MSETTVWRIWQTVGLKPHRTETFKYSTDPALEAKVRDVVGLSLRRPNGRSCSLSRREDPDPGARPNGADAAAEARAWLERHPRITFHFTPTSASWMNQIETWFGILSREAIRRGSFGSVKELIARIDLFAANCNAGASPFA
jgi:DDE superfamily endonuclease